MSERQTQRSQILAALLCGDRLTALDGLRRFKCFRIGARCWDLKREGYDVKSERIKTKSGTYIARYYMGE